MLKWIKQRLKTFPSFEIQTSWSLAVLAANKNTRPELRLVASSKANLILHIATRQKEFITSLTHKENRSMNTTRRQKVFHLVLDNLGTQIARLYITTHNMHSLAQKLIKMWLTEQWLGGPVVSVYITSDLLNLKKTDRQKSKTHNVAYYDSRITSKFSITCHLMWRRHSASHVFQLYLLQRSPTASRQSNRLSMLNTENEINAQHKNIINTTKLKTVYCKMT